MEKPEGYNILPGMTATVRGEKIITKLENSNILVPSHSVLKDSDGQYVFIAEKTEDVFGIVKRRKVEIGTLSEQGLNITNGLQPGDILVIAGMSKMQDGMKVKLMDKDQ